ncbi:MAG: phosphate signaling complex protein PhoU [Phycisphaerales bacterium]
MPLSPKAFEQRTLRLKADMAEQGRRVQAMLESSIEALFDGDRAKAQSVIDRDSLIDKVDVDIERAAVSLLCDATKEAANITEDQLRMVLTVVKVNNELERIADSAVIVAERVLAEAELPGGLPPVFRMMANSVIGIVQGANDCFDRLDTDGARVVLASDDTVDAFEQQILRDAQQRFAAGEIDGEVAFAMHTIAAELERVGDHCTNIAEQVIYVVTGKIVRHTEGHWTAPESPE